MSSSPRSSRAIEVRNLTKWYRVDGHVVQALDGVTLGADEGEFVSIVGPSGSGKTTLFNLICGLSRPDSGQIFIQGREMRGQRGQVAYMPQKDVLLPWRTLLQNVLLGAEVDGQPMLQARQEALALMPEFGLEGFEDRYPHELSGGMRQRAALLRTYLFHRDVLLLDEPFGALDALTRRQMQVWLMGVWEEHRKTILFVTHDVDEAVFLSDRIYALTPRPARVSHEMVVDLPRPRTPALLSAPEFVAARAELLEALLPA
ncbi:MAG: ABC transporter ATP-binding protein [Anaerolineae bacterium]|jgi:ABC-type nitrate/sulfonate/bicarbonate transport system ATPase subunit